MLVLGASISFSSAQVGNYSVGDVVNDFTVTDTDGNTINLYAITATGKYVFLDFFFDTCPPCQTTSQYFSELHEKYGCNEGDIYCIAMNNGSDSDAEVIAYENTYGGSSAHPPAVSADGGAAAVDTDLGIPAYPTYCVIGPDNKLFNADIWPIEDITTFENAFPSGGFNVMDCNTASVEEMEVSTALNIYPNPTSNDLNLVVDLTENTNVTLEVYNVLGKLEFTQNIGQLASGQTNYTLNVSSLNTGNYILKLNSDKGVAAVSSFVKM